MIILRQKEYVQIVFGVLGNGNVPILRRLSVAANTIKNRITANMSGNTRKMAEERAEKAAKEMNLSPELAEKLRQESIKDNASTLAIHKKTGEINEDIIKNLGKKYAKRQMERYTDPAYHVVKKGSEFLEDPIMKSADAVSRVITGQNFVRPSDIFGPTKEIVKGVPVLEKMNNFMSGTRSNAANKINKISKSTDNQWKSGWKIVSDKFNGLLSPNQRPLYQG